MKAETKMRDFSLRLISILVWFEILWATVFLIGIVVLSLWFAEWRLYKSKEADVTTKIESIAETKLAEEAIQLIQDNGKIAEFAKIRDALSANIQSGSRLSIIYPEMINDVEVYHELTAWWYRRKENDQSIADAGLPRFVPNSEERKKFEQLIAGEITAFTVPRGSHLRSFRMVQTSGGKMILLVDTSRRADYSRGSFK